MRISRAAVVLTTRDKHGMSRTAEYRVWVGMRDRCYNEDHTSFERYGGRGIRVCEAWNTSFRAFYNDVGPRPGKGWDLARLDPDGHYEPGNAEWQPHATNMKHLRPRHAN